MLSKKPHISIKASSLVPRVLRIDETDFATWPEAVRATTISLAEELFLAMYNPYVPAEMVKKSVAEHFALFRRGLAHHYATSIEEGITMFWSAYDSNVAFTKEVVTRLEQVLPATAINTDRYDRIANATDATDLRLELPMLVIAPTTVEQIIAVIRLANEMQFALIPRGGGSGLTGGAVPARKRSVILSSAVLSSISPIDKENATITVQAGALTINTIKAAEQEGFLFSVDPASKTASTIGGNISENAGGPLCFEYGTTIDNLLSYRMVTPTGELIDVHRKDHPRHKINPDETAIFEVKNTAGEVLKTITIPGEALRKPGLGKDVTNKALCGLPGVQKEGVDGIILDAKFILHEKLKHYKVMVLEFYGRSMDESTHVIGDIVNLRDKFRAEGDHVKISALEEFNSKYVQAINYQKKDSTLEGNPISVLIVQFDSNKTDALDSAVQKVIDICNNYKNVSAFTAKDNAEAEVYWEDRHRLSAIAKRTSGFKINEDIVIPLSAVPEFARFLESLNLEYMARAYRTSLKELESLATLPEEEARVVAELAYTTRILQGEITTADLSDEELNLHATRFLRDFAKENPAIRKELTAIENKRISTCICVASHMHAGDGNCHVNIPVNSNDPKMLAAAEKVAHTVMAKAQELGGEVTGEHGIGITKIAFLTEEKMADIADFKMQVDPRNIFNPAKLTQRTLPVAPFTFSFNHLIQDIKQSGLIDKENLISLLTKIQTCTRCGKCKQVCPMRDPSRLMHHHPRNKNMVVGSLIEAIYYTQVNTGKVLPSLLAELRDIFDHCTACGKCEAACPLKIASGEVALTVRGYLEEEGAGGHPIKMAALSYVAKKPAQRLVQVGKMSSLGQGLQNEFLKIVPEGIKKRLASPMFSGPGPKPMYRNLYETLHLSRGSLFVPEGEIKGTLFYFPGCGSSVFYRNISLAGISLMLKAGYAVLVPEKPLCCGYPLLASGAQEAFASNQDNNVRYLRKLVSEAKDKGFSPSRVLTSCGSCRDGMQRHFIEDVFESVGCEAVMDDAAHFLFSVIGVPAGEKGKCATQSEETSHQDIIYHAPCHAEVAGVKKTDAAKLYAKDLSHYLGSQVHLSPGCCGESGLGAMTTPHLYNKVRERKSLQLDEDMMKIEKTAPVVVTCPSCYIGLNRIMMQKENKRQVLHALVYMAESFFGEGWQKKCQKLIGSTPRVKGMRTVAMDSLASIKLTKEEEIEE